MSGVVNRHVIIQPVQRGARGSVQGLAWTRRFRFAVVPAALLLLWQLSASLKLVPLLILPSPLQVWQGFFAASTGGTLLAALEISLQRLVFGYAFGVALGLPLGLLFAISPVIRKLIAPSFWFIVRVPLLAWIPFLMVLFGIGEVLKLVIIAKAVMTPVTINTERAIRGIPAGWRELGRLYRLSPWLTLRRILFPATILPVFTGLRLGLVQAWAVLVAVELLASSNGIGFQLTMARQLFQLDTMLALMAVVGAIGFLLDRVLVLTERQIARRYGGAA
jgi:sulfonate transport system permease protein